MATYKNAIPSVQSNVAAAMAFPAPVDINAYFENYNEALMAAAVAVEAGDTSSTEAKNYFGQVVSVTINGVPTIYKIQKDDSYIIETTFIDSESTIVKVDFDKKLIISTTNPYIVGVDNIEYNNNNYYSLCSEDTRLCYALVKDIPNGYELVTDIDNINQVLYNGTSSSGASYGDGYFSPDTITLTKSNGKLVSLENASEVGEQVLQEAKAYTDEQIAGLDVTDTAVSKQFVTAVSETDGKITVSRRALTGDDLPNVSIDKLVAGTTNPTIPAALLPAYVDDVIELQNITGTVPASPVKDMAYYSPNSAASNKNKIVTYNGTSWVATNPESGKIYVDLTDNKTYRYGGSGDSGLVVISETLALGETSSTAYRGDRGKTAYDHATDSSRLTTAKTTAAIYKITTTSEGHIASATAATGSDIETLLGTSLSSKADKKVPTAAGNVATLDANGNLADSGISKNSIITDVSDKADKVTGGSTNGKLAALDSNGNLTNSNITASEVVVTGDSRLAHASDGTEDTDLGLISKAELAKITGSGTGSIAEAKGVADYAIDLAASKQAFLGTTNTNVTASDASEQITISGETKTAAIGDVCVYNNVEYRWMGSTNKWVKVGSGSNVINSITFAGTAMTIDSTTKTASITKSAALSALNVADGAEVNVQSDWNETSNTSDAFIKNKPTLGTLAGKSSITDSDVASNAAIATSKISGLDAALTKLNGIANNAEVNVQSDWNETDNSKDSYILNKPTLGSLAGKSTIDNNDIASNAAIATSKISGLDTALAKLNGIEAGADVNVIEEINVKYNTSDIATIIPDSNKSVTIDISELILDGGSATEQVSVS